MRSIYLLIAGFSLFAGEVCPKFITSCYWNSWSVYRMGKAQSNVRTIDGKLCTHLIYNTATISRNYEVIPADPWNDLPDGGGKANYRKFILLRNDDNNLKLLLGVGGWNTGSIKFSEMASKIERRNSFIDSAVKLAKAHGFDGVNVNWQFPTRRGGKPVDKENFATLLKEMYEVFLANKLLLTMDTSASPNIIVEAYDIQAITRNVDIMHLTTFDYYGNWDSITGLGAALYHRPEDRDKRLNINYTISQLKELGADRSKIVVIISTVGQTWTLRNPSDTSIGAEAKGPGLKGEYTQHPGILSYVEICERFDKGRWTIIRETHAKVPYAYQGDQWISYDDEESVKEKVKYIVSNGLAGAGLYSLDTDDFKNICDSGRYPLLNAIKSGLK